MEIVALWGLFAGLVLGTLFVDLLVFNKKPHVMSPSGSLRVERHLVFPGRVVRAPPYSSWRGRPRGWSSSRATSSSGP